MIWDPFPMRAVPKLRVIRRDYRMPMDLVDEGDNYRLIVDLPGIRKEDVKISMNEGILSLSVEGKEEKDEKDERYLMRERSAYSCSRKIRLPGEVDEDNIKANIEEGVLNIQLPKKEPEKHKPREIKIE
jgi:HSP20 family protein